MLVTTRGVCERAHRVDGGASRETTRRARVMSLGCPKRPLADGKYPAALPSVISVPKLAYPDAHSHDATQRSFGSSLGGPAPMFLSGAGSSRQGVGSSAEDGCARLRSSRLSTLPMASLGSSGSLMKRLGIL